jgi:hypothetical protein
MGKKAKEHRKKVKARNERIMGEYKRATKMAWEKFEELKKQNDKDTDNQSFQGITQQR